MIRKSTICAVLIWSISSNVFAWSWNDVVNQAVSKSPNLNSQRQNVEITSLSYHNAKALRYPTLRLIGQFVEYQDQTENFRYRAFLGPQLDFLIYQGGKIRAGIDVAQSQNQQAALTVRTLSVSMLSQLRQAYASALYAKNYLELTRRIEQRRMENAKLSKIQYQSGQEYKWAYATSEVKWKQSQLDAQQAEMNKKTALSDLENILGPLPVQSVEELSDENFLVAEEAYNLDQLVTNVKKNPKYELQEARVNESEAGVEVARADFYPTIGLRANLYAMSTERNELFPAWYAGALLAMPIFQANRIHRNVASAKAQLSKSNFDLQQVGLDVKTSLQKTFQNYTIAKQQVEVSKLAVAASQDRAKVVSNQYRSGLTSFFDWDTSQDLWVKAEIDLLTNIRNYQVSRARLEEAMGMELRQ